MRTVAVCTGSLTVRVGKLGLRAGSRPALSLQSSSDLDELFQLLCHDDSTVNIMLVSSL